MATADRPRLAWLDALRVASCTMVIAVHACDPYNLLSPPGEAPFWGAFYGSLMRSCVPLFLMIAGALLFPVTMPAGEFLRRRFSRILLPFVAWSVLYAVVPAFFGHGLTLEPKPYGWADAGASLLRLPVNFQEGIWHFWYMYVLAGLYLFAPVLSPWIKGASKRSLQGFLALWGVTLCLPYLKLFHPMIQGEAEWNTHDMLSPFAGYLGYMVLGYYLARHPPAWSRAKRLLVAGAMFAAGFAVTWAGFLHTFRHQKNPGEMFGGLMARFADSQALSIPPAVLIEQFWWYLSINVALMTAAVFLVFQTLEIRSERVRAVLAELSTKSFGVFLAHLFFVYNVHRWMEPLNIPAWLGIPLNGVLTFLLSYVLVKALWLSPTLRRIVN